MRDQTMTLKENYMDSLLKKEDASKNQSRTFAKELGLERISISPAEAQLAKVLLKMHGGKRFIEIGTLTGLSAQYFIEALPEDGELWTLEKDPNHVRMAQEVFQNLSKGRKQLNLVIGDARVELETLSAQGPFDGIFIDGNKAAYLDYLLWAEKNLRTGGLVLADNIFLSGAVWGESTIQKFSEKQIRIMKEFNERLADSSLYESAIVPSYEGLYIAIKK